MITLKIIITRSTGECDECQQKQIQLRTVENQQIFFKKATTLLSGLRIAFLSCDQWRSAADSKLTDC